MHDQMYKNSMAEYQPVYEDFPESQQRTTDVTDEKNITQEFSDKRTMSSRVGKLSDKKNSVLIEKGINW